VAAERAGSDLQLNRQSARLQAKFSALGSLKSALSGFQSTLSGINSANTFTNSNATSSDSAVLGASAGNNVIPNNYSVAISQLAASHSLASPAVETDDATAIGTGSITFRFGTTDYDGGTDTYSGFVENPETSSATIAIDSSNNTLQGISRAINEADIGVNASVIFNGSDYQLLMTSAEAGLQNSLEITVADGDGNSTDTSGLSQLAFNSSATNMEQTVAALDANLVINGLNITSSSNTVDSAIEGVSLSLKQVSASPVQVSVEPDTEGVKAAVNEFVSGYNQFIEVGNALSAYNAETRQAAALVGDFTLRSIEGQIGSILRGSRSIQGGSFSTLAEIGITTTSSGTLTVDDARLTEVLEQDLDRVAQMFTAFGSTDSAGISYLGSSNATLPGEYGIEVTSLAQAGFYDGASVLPTFIGAGQGNNVLIDNDNDDLTVAIDGIEAVITLTQDLYTSGASLAAELQTQINGNAALSSAGVSVTVTYNAATDSLSMASDSVGSDSSIEFVAVDTDTAATLGFTVGSGTDGVDLAGSIGDVPATITGNIWLAGSGSGAEGLRLQVNGNTLGSRGNVTFDRGVGSQLDSLLDQMLDIEGALTDRIESFENRLEDIEDRRERLELRWEAVRERYTTQFNALDTLLGQLQGTSTFLEQQLGGLIQPNSVNSQ
ncbi:MAG: flagellar filament capping protein FliD, partial [Gammaproteobacteria bacterium]|nr:flagellar filament capping protein FliD [Gammaproteobacteria bacterium]